MNPEEAHKLDLLASQLNEHVMTLAVVAQEICTVVRTRREGALQAGPGRSAITANHLLRPLLDETTLSVIWRDKTLHLGHTLAFRFLARLARRPNQYVTHLELLREVWDNEDLATATIRSLIRELRRKLRDGGMTDLAAAIRGHNGRYILEL